MAEFIFGHFCMLEGFLIKYINAATIPPHPHPYPGNIFQCSCFFFILSLIDTFKKRKEQKRRNLLKKGSGNCKAPEELIILIPKLKYFEPSTSCSNESVDCSDIISNTSEGDNATPKKDFEQVILLTGLITKNRPTGIVFPKTMFGKKER